MFRYVTAFMAPSVNALDAFTSAEKEKLAANSPAENLTDYSQLSDLNIRLAFSALEGSVRAMNSFFYDTLSKGFLAWMNTFQDEDCLCDFASRLEEVLKVTVREYPKAVEAIKAEFGFHLDNGGYEKAAETSRFDLYQVRPDLTTLGKIIGGGMPVGALGGRRDVMERLAPLGPVYQAGTLSGNPVAMVAGLTTLELIAAPGFHAQLAATTEALVSGLKQAAAQAGVSLATNHVCGMFGIFFTEDRRVDSFERVMGCDVERFKRFFHRMLDAGIYLAPSAFEAGFVSAAHTREDLDATLAAAAGAFAALDQPRSATG